MIYSSRESPNPIPCNSLDKVTLNSGYIDTYWAGARTLGGPFAVGLHDELANQNVSSRDEYGGKCSDKFLVQEFEAHNLSFPGNYGFQMIFVFWSSLHIKLSSPWWCFWERCKWNSGEHLLVTQVDSTKPGEVHVREIIPRAISFGHSPPTTVTVTDRHTGHSFHTFILHTLRAETWPAYNWYQRSTTSSFGKSPRRMSFSSLIVHLSVRKKETTGPRVLIFILVFSFLMLEFSFCFAFPVPACRSGLPSAVHDCFVYRAQAGLQPLAIGAPFGRSHLHGD